MHGFTDESVISWTVQSPCIMRVSYMSFPSEIVYIMSAKPSRAAQLRIKNRFAAGQAAGHKHGLCLGQSEIQNPDGTTRLVDCPNPAGPRRQLCGCCYTVYRVAFLSLALDPAKQSMYETRMIRTGLILAIGAKKQIKRTSLLAKLVG